MISLIAGVAAITDLIWGRIFNWWTIPAMSLGLIASFLSGGWGVGINAIAAVFVALIVYGILFAFGVIGAGDVKLLMAFGAWGGLQYVERVAVLGVVLGGITALVIMIISGRIKDFSRRMYRFLLTVMVKELVVETPNIDRKFTMPFGVPIAAAAVWIAWGNSIWF